MIKRLVFGLLLAVSATPAMAQDTAGEFSWKLRPTIGKPLGETTIKIASVHSEGRLAILVLDSPDWAGERQTVAMSFVREFCKRDPEFFAKKTLRIDTLDKGNGLITGRVYDKCPAGAPS